MLLGQMDLGDADVDMLAVQLTAALDVRWIMLAFSAVGNTEACVTRRRISRPDSGFATIPTIASPTPINLLALTLRARPRKGNNAP